MPDMLETFSALISALSVCLITRRSLWGWPVSLLSTFLYSWIFYQAHLYADVILQGIFCLGIIYGWWLWLRDYQHKTSTSDLTTPSLPARPLRFSVAFYGTLITSVIACGWSIALHRWSNDPTPIMDATLSSASLLAQLWTARRYRESWLLWAVIDLIYVGLFISRMLYPTAVLYSGFVIIALYGYYTWRPAPQSER